MKKTSLFQPSGDLELLRRFESGDLELLGRLIWTWKECFRLLDVGADESPLETISIETRGILSRSLVGGYSVATHMRRTNGPSPNSPTKKSTTKGAVKAYGRSCKLHLEKRFEQLLRKRGKEYEEASLKAAHQKVLAVQRFIPNLESLLAAKRDEAEFVLELNKLRKAKGLTLVGLAQVFVACEQIVARIKALPPDSLTRGMGRAVGAIGMQVTIVVVHEPTDRKCGRPCIDALGLQQIADDQSACRATGNSKSIPVEPTRTRVRQQRANP